MKVAVLFDNFGPYHLARLAAAGKVADVLGVEFAATSNEYAWERRHGGATFRRTTLYNEGPSRQCAARVLRDRLELALAEFRPDVVAIPGWSGRLAFSALAWSLRNNIPAVMMSESSARDAARFPWREALKRRCVAACAAALVGGQRHRQYLVDLGMPPERIFLGYNAVENEHFRRGAAETREDGVARSRALGLTSEFFLASARFVDKKNLAGLLNAYALYRRQRVAVSGREPWDLVLLGDGPLRGELEYLRNKLGLDAAIRMPGFQQYDELPTYYGLANAFVHASSVEPWGLVVNEAMAAGLPVLVSNRCGCVPDLVQDGVNGWTFNPDDRQNLADCFVRFAALPDSARHNMAARGQEIAADFGPERFATGLDAAAMTALTVQPASRSIRSCDLLLLRALSLKT